MVPPNVVDAETREPTQPDPVRDALTQRYLALAEEVRTLGQRVKLDQRRLAEARPALSRVRHQLIQFGYPVPETVVEEGAQPAPTPTPSSERANALVEGVWDVVDGVTFGLWRRARAR